MPKLIKNKGIQGNRKSESRWFNLFMLRRLYNPENSGRGTEGVNSRYDLHPTITHKTYLSLADAVPVGKGLYGSSVTELALRLLIASVCDSIPKDMVAEELSQAVTDKHTLAHNLRDLSDAILEYKLPSEMAVTKAEAKLQKKAKELGFGQEFRQIVEAARSVGLYARFQENWQIVMFTPHNNHNFGLLDLGTNLGMWIDLPKIAEYLNCSTNLVKQKLVFDKEIKPKDVSQWIDNFNALFSTHE